MWHEQESPKTQRFERSASTSATPARTLQPSAMLVTVLGVAGFATLAGSLRNAATFDESSIASAMAAIGCFLAATTMIAWRRAVEQLPRRARSNGKLGSYTLDERIGEGAMGVVYRGRHDYLERPAAIKVLRAEHATELDITRFEREVQRTSRLTHPNTIGIYDFGRTDDGSFYYAMELIDGLDLQTLVERHGPQEPARVAHLLAQLAGSLAEAHANGIVHRDVKPANVMICERGGARDVVKVLDFGLSRELGDRSDGAADDAQFIIGTPLYLSPEALARPEAVDARSDLYAVGALGYFLLTGTTPFAGGSLLEVCGHHLHTTPETPSARLGSALPQTLEKLILSCLAKSPDLRPASAPALRKALLGMAAAWTEERAARWWNEHDGERGAPDVSSLIAPPAHESQLRAIAA